MKTLNYRFLMFCIFIANLSSAQMVTVVKETRLPVPVITCADFELRDGLNYSAGWYGYNTSDTFSSPSMDNTYFRQSTALTSGAYLSSGLYPDNLSKFKGQCLCFDYKVIDDGLPGTSMAINPTLILFDGAAPQVSTIQAKFVANYTVTENSGWVHVCAPLEFSSGGNLPSNANGQWTNVTAAQWDALLVNAGSIGFTVDVGGPRSKASTIGVDNVCIQDCEDVGTGGTTPTQDGAYCCDDKNLVTNGNFEDSQSAFLSQYGVSNNPYPGEYQITSSAAAFGANIKDHSYCADPVQFANNKKFMLVNGKTQQPGSSSVIWTQSVSGLEKGKTYKFCANFKNMPQCTFDILPNINMEVNGIGDSGFSTISADPNNPCDWVTREFNFIATGTSVNLKIILDESGNGDGNDVAIDDIAVSKLTETDLSISVEHQGNPQKITASINTMNTSDDKLPGEKCDYYWFVSKVDSYPPVVLDFSTFAYGNNSGNSNGTSSWNLTTSFPDYAFSQNTMYIVGMYTPECDCYDKGFTYQLTYNNRPMGDDRMSEEQKQQIINIIRNGKPTEQFLDASKKNNPDHGLRMYPNPSQGNFNLSIQGNTLKDVQIYSVSGQPVFTQTYSEGTVQDEINISAFSTGIYFVKAKGTDGKEYNGKLIKE